MEYTFEGFEGIMYKKELNDLLKELKINKDQAEYGFEEGYHYLIYGSTIKWSYNPYPEAIKISIRDLISVLSVKTLTYEIY